MQSKACFNDARKAHRQTWRRYHASREEERDKMLSVICSKDPYQAYKHLKSVRTASATNISEIYVGNDVYTGKNVSTGFFENLKKLKTEHDPATNNCESCVPFKFDHKHIIEICKSGEKIPLLSLPEAEKLLHSLKPSVCDHWSISALHYINGGPIALKHFQLIINLAIENIENTTVDEVNTAHACILYKGHQKDKNQASSYKTISSCPFTAKCLDTHIRNLSLEDWHNA